MNGFSLVRDEPESGEGKDILVLLIWDTLRRDNIERLLATLGAILIRLILSPIHKLHGHAATQTIGVYPEHTRPALDRNGK